MNHLIKTTRTWVLMTVVDYNKRHISEPITMRYQYKGRDRKHGWVAYSGQWSVFRKTQKEIFKHISEHGDLRGNNFEVSELK